MNQKIKNMTAAGKILGEVLEEVLNFTKPGVSEVEIDRLAEALILKKGGQAGFKKVPGYKNTICISTNNVVVHGIPTSRVLKAGDVVGIDCGVYFNGYHTDMAETIIVQNSKFKVQSSVDKFLKTGKKALYAGIKKARMGNRIGHISNSIQEIVEQEGYSVVRSLVGHGVGKELHEKPEIPGYLSGKIERTPLIHEGDTLAIEVIYNMGKPDVIYDEGDDWTIITTDASISGLFERTLLITKNGPKLLTKLSSDKSGAFA